MASILTLISSQSNSSITIVLVLVPISLFVFLYSQRFKSNVPVYNPKRFWEFTTMRAKQDFDANATTWLRKWFSQYPNTPIRLIADSGYCTVLPPAMGNELRKAKEIDMYAFIKSSYHVHLPGFDGLREECSESHLIPKIILNHLSKNIAKMTVPMAVETGAAVSDIFGEETEWHVAPIYQQCLDFVSRTASHTFLGEKLYRNKEWQAVTKEHAIAVAVAARELRYWPAPLRPLIHRFGQKGQQLRSQVQRTRALIEPVLEERRAEQAMCAAQGIDPPEFNDTLQWFEDAAAGRPYDPVGAQLAMAFASIYATTDLLVGVIADLCRHPEIIEPLRDEIREVISKQGWTQAAIVNLKLLDSCLKETQRMKPVESATMRSEATRDITLSDGTRLPKGEVVAVSATRMMDPNVYEDPETWDGHRYLRWRNQPETEAIAQLVSTSADAYGFGWFPRACPGRFFAAHGLKIALAHILIRYDINPVEGEGLKFFSHSFVNRVHPATRVMLRRRDEDISSELQIADNSSSLL